MQQLGSALRPHVVDLSFIVTHQSSAHQKIKALLCHINFDYMTNFVKKCFVFISIFFLHSIKKDKKIHTELDRASKFTLTAI